MENNFQTTDNGFDVKGSIVKIVSKAAKGGAIQLLVECPLLPKLADAAYSHYEKIGTVRFEYEESQLPLPYEEGEEGTPGDESGFEETPEEGGENL